MIYEKHASEQTKMPKMRSTNEEAWKIHEKGWDGGAEILLPKMQKKHIQAHRSQSWRQEKEKEQEKEDFAEAKSKKPIMLDDLIKYAIRIEKCIFCGSNRIIKKGKYTVLDGLIKIQRFMCKECGKTFSRLTILRLGLRQFYRECPICKEISSIIRRGREKGEDNLLLQEMQSKLRSSSNSKENSKEKSELLENKAKASDFNRENTHAKG